MEVMVGRGGVTMERTLQRGVLVWRHQALSLTHCIPKEETSCCLIWLVSWEEFLLCGQLGGAGACMRMVGSFTVRRSPAPGHGCILQSPLGRNLKHYLRCTSTNDTRHHPTPTLYLHTFLFFYSHWRFWSTGQQRNSRKQQGGHTFTWFRHFAHIGFHSKVMFRNFCTSTRFRYTFYFRYHKLWFTSFSQMRNYWHTQKMPYFVQTS